VAPPALTGFVLVKIAVPPQFTSGPNRVKVMLPVGEAPPLNVAVSVMEVPTGPPGDAVVLMVGVAFVTVDDSFGSLQLPEAGMLLASPP
jgi:hypothetical protein